MKIAAVAFACDRFPDWTAQEAKLDALIRDAAADLVVLPEYAALEAAFVAAPASMSPLEWRDRAAARAEGWVQIFRHLAARHNCHILAGSGPALTDRGVVNRAWLVSPTGAVVHQDKLILTPYERDVLDMVSGEEMKLIDTPLGKIGILICYDSEFPLQARALCEAGADMILVPSCTDLPAGQTRVRQSCRARAIENQCLIVQAPLVGTVEGCDIIDQSTGCAALFCPPDTGLPGDGIIAQGLTDRPGPVVADVTPSAIAAPRTSGQVGNFAHWPESRVTVKEVPVPATE